MFIIGFCPNCGKQSQVRDVKGRPIGLCPGAKSCYLVLSDGLKKTRIGSFTLCSYCDPATVSPLKIKQVLIESRVGLTGNETEFKILPELSIEVIATYEERKA